MPQPQKWKGAVAWTGAVLAAALFLLAGIWKMTDPIEAGARLAQARVPGMLSEFAAVSFGIAETFAAILILIPRYRKLGAYLIGLMLVAFMIWVGYFYQELQGKECSCFPWIKRAVGPGFFIGDGIMLAGAVAAGWWARWNTEWKLPAVLLVALSVFGVSSYVYALSKQSGAVAPESVQMVNGETHNLREGRQAIYFFDPQCMHCFHAAQAMSKLDFNGTKVLAVPTEVKQFAGQFLTDTKFSVAQISNDTDKLKKAFPFGDPPFLVLLENGRQKAAINQFDEPAFPKRIIDLGFATVKE
ncbi:MauE/DoxX family redox-associated membrane protein [Bryobacter aggregatus]|uniref:MauE/DoxX family redox-associated membrane protein n=1 Tax=Bryobacter aggregatus TaxID=360054 RepID=UPI00138E0736|nr:MauE/DoxX family redox-associated membrane protein [Bryobacter aggregatus]